MYVNQTERKFAHSPEFVENICIGNSSSKLTTTTKDMMESGQVRRIIRIIESNLTTSLRAL